MQCLLLPLELAIGISGFSISSAPHEASQIPADSVDQLPLRSCPSFRGRPLAERLAPNARNVSRARDFTVAPALRDKDGGNDEGQEQQARLQPPTLVFPVHCRTSGVIALKD
jgi:hypothetical protein